MVTLIKPTYLLSFVRKTKCMETGSLLVLSSTISIAPAKARPRQAILPAPLTPGSMRASRRCLYRRTMTIERTSSSKNEIKKVANLYITFPAVSVIGKAKGRRQRSGVFMVILLRQAVPKISASRTKATLISAPGITASKSAPTRPTRPSARAMPPASRAAGIMPAMQYPPTA